MRWTEATDVDRPQIHRRLAAGDPFGSARPGASGRRDANALKPAPTKKPRKSGASPIIQLPSGVNDSGPLISCLIPAVCQRRHARDRLLHQRLEVLPVVVEQLEVKPSGCRASAQAMGFGS
jgi:hypothetical protein